MANHPATHHTVLLAGDFNATLQTADRLSGSNDKITDKMHRQFVQGQGLHPTEATDAARSPTYRKHGYAPCSRIDDILLNIPTTPSMHTTVTTLYNSSTDHDLLQLQAPHLSLHLMPPPVPTTSLEAAETERLKTPLTATHALVLRAHI